MAADYCEDYPCCGHTPSDPCKRQWYDEPGAFDKLDWDDIQGYEDEEQIIAKANVYLKDHYGWDVAAVSHDIEVEVVQ